MSNCPLNLNCAVMGMSSGGCSNLATCVSALSNHHEDEEIEEDALSSLNTNLRRTYYPKSVEGWRCTIVDERSDWFWIVDRRSLPPGYIAAEEARLPCIVEKGKIIVVLNDADREYQVAEKNPNFFLELENELITVIEWHEVKGKREIRQIHTEENQYWCDELKDGSLLCSTDSNDCIEYEYWCFDEQDLKFYGDQVKRVDSPFGGDPERLRALLESAWICESSLYCSVCQDYMPAEPDRECRHIWWVDSWGELGGCGYCEHSDLTATYQDHVFAYLDLAGLPSVLALKEALEAHSYEIASDVIPIASCEAWYSINHRLPDHSETWPVRFGHRWSSFSDEGDLDGEDEQLEPALIWFKSLESGKTIEADNLTVKWIETWINQNGETNANSALEESATRESWHPT